MQRHALVELLEGAHADVRLRGRGPPAGDGTPVTGVRTCVWLPMRSKLRKNWSDTGPFCRRDHRADLRQQLAVLGRVVRVGHVQVEVGIGLAVQRLGAVDADADALDRDRARAEAADRG